MRNKESQQELEIQQLNLDYFQKVFDYYIYGTQPAHALFYQKSCIYISLLILSFKHHVAFLAIQH